MKYPIEGGSHFGVNFRAGVDHQAGEVYGERRNPIGYNPDILTLANSTQPSFTSTTVQNVQAGNLGIQHRGHQDGIMSATNYVEKVMTEAKYEAPTACNSKVFQPSKTSKQVVDDRVKHLLEKHNEQWKCTECGKIGQLWHVRRHVEVHLTDLNFPCSHCGKVSKSSHGLYQHTAKQHPEAKLALKASARHKCSICGTGAKTSKGLSNHRWKYHRPGAQLANGNPVSESEWKTDTE